MVRRRHLARYSGQRLGVTDASQAGSETNERRETRMSKNERDMEKTVGDVENLTSEQGKGAVGSAFVVASRSWNRRLCNRHRVLASSA